MKQNFCPAFSFFIWILTVVLSTSLSTAEDPEEKTRLPVAMEVFLKKPEPRLFELHVHLINVSDEPVEVDVRDLPWNPNDGPTWLSAFRMDAQQSPIKQYYPLGWFGSRIVRLVPVSEKMSDLFFVLYREKPVLSPFLMSFSYDKFRSE